MTDDTALLVSLNNNPSWLPQEYIQKKIRQILCAALVITVLHLVLLKVLSVLLANRSASSAKTTEKTERESVRFREGKINYTLESELPSNTSSCKSVHRLFLESIMYTTFPPWQT
mmetsp:Transcript_14459/g.20380  ORF Transcript_14459/g.20380 Transcript_14459/m.20380 type:complete len:115 (+) Transcript_14459:54-398(+)